MSASETANNINPRSSLIDVYPICPGCNYVKAWEENENSDSKSLINGFKKQLAGNNDEHLEGNAFNCS